jgi:hypothetical protein
MPKDRPNSKANPNAILRGSGGVHIHNNSRRNGQPAARATLPSVWVLRPPLDGICCLMQRSVDQTG